MTTHPSKIIYRHGGLVADTIAVCPNQDIAIQVGALTVTLPLAKWHELGREHIQNPTPTGRFAWLKKLFGG